MTVKLKCCSNSQIQLSRIRHLVIVRLHHRGWYSRAELVSQADGRLLYWMYTLLVSMLLAAICRIVAAASPWRSSGYQLGDQTGSE